MAFASGSTATGVALCSNNPHIIGGLRLPLDLPKLDLHPDANGLMYCISCEFYHKMVVYPAPTETGPGPTHEFGTAYNPPIQWWRCAQCKQNTVGAFGHCHKCDAIHQPPKQTAK